MRVLVIGKAKTGTTALVSLIKQSLDPCDLVMEPGSVLAFAAQSQSRTGNEAIKILWEHFRSRHRHLDAIVHGEFGFPVDKVVFISRDVRDEMVSKLLYHAKIARDDNLIPEPRAQIAERWVDALRAKEHNPASISFHGLCRIFESLYAIDLWSRVTDMREKQRFETYLADGVGRDRYVLAYEDMVADRTGGLSDYLGVPMPARVAAVDLGQYGHTRRSGRSGNWRSFFTDEDVEILRPLISQMLPGELYQDWKLDAEPRIDPAEVSGYVARIAAV